MNGWPTAYRCSHATYYVSTTGSDANSGTSEATPLQHIQTALDRSTLGVGDCVVVLAGTYTESLAISHGGTSDSADGYFVVRSETPVGAKLQPSSTGNAIWIGASYVIVDGFDVTNPVGDYRIGSSGQHHPQILNNDVHGCGGGGVGFAWGDYYLVQNNTASGNAGTTTYQESGFSAWEPRAVAGSEPGFHIVVRGNVALGNRITFDCPDASPGCHTDGNGFIMDDFQNTQADGGGRTRTRASSRTTAASTTAGAESTSTIRSTSRSATTRPTRTTPTSRTTRRGAATSRRSSRATARSRTTSPWRTRR